MTSKLSLIFAVLAVAAVLTVSPVYAQTLSGGIGIGWAWQNVGGNEHSFRSQVDLQEGLFLESLELENAGLGHGLSLEAWGFGKAEPAESARFALGLATSIDLSLHYDSRRSFIGLANGDLSWRGDKWDINRWKASLKVDSWAPVRAIITYRKVQREGSVLKPFFGLNEVYQAAVDIDESKSEFSLRLITKTLPVRLELEQSYARYDRQNRRSPGSGSVIDGTDADVLSDLTANYDDTIDVPTTRLGASFSSRSFEGAASLLFSSADLETSGAGWQSYGIGGGGIGSIEFFDTLVGSSQQDTVAGTLHLAQRLGERWLIRFDGSYRDGSADSTLLGERLFRAGNPTGYQLEFGTPVDESSVFDFTDNRTDLVLETSGQTWTAWVGGFSGSREVSWRLEEDSSTYREQRDHSGYLAGVRWAPTSRFDGSLELEQGSFEKYIFRTDPKEVDRATFKIRSRLGNGWRLAVHGRYEDGSSARIGADIDHQSDAHGVALTWSAAETNTTLGLDLESVNIQTQTGLVLPGGESGESVYDLDLLTLTAWGDFELGPARVNFSATRLDDSGSTWPVESWNAHGRAALSCGESFDCVVFVQHYSYEEELATFDDFDVTRYGVAVHWRFQ